MATSPPTDCLVCRKHRGLEKIPGGAIFENSLVFISHAQLWAEETTHYLGHLFVEPKRHVPELAQLRPIEAKELGLFLSLAAKAIQAVCETDHVYSFVLGDHVPHIHFHLIGRYPGAPTEYWGPRVDEWPDAPRGGPAEIEALAERLRKVLAQLAESTPHEGNV
jgi:histidine triad (HIT) family protein